MTVPSATNLDINTGCATGTADVTDFGVVLPASSAVTGTDCSITFGSSNDTSMLRIAQDDAYGVGMWAFTRGTPDPAFGVAGLKSIDLGANDDIGDVVVEPGGNIWVAGYASGSDAAIVRLLDNGDLDLGWAGDGSANFALGGSDDANAVEPAADGGAFIAGHVNFPDDSYIGKADATGAVDAAFSGGWVITNFYGAGDDDLRDIQELSDGRIMAVGWSDDADQWLLARYMPDGTPDITCNGSGSRIIPTLDGHDLDAASSVHLLDDGTFLVGGVTDTADSSSFAVARFNEDCSTDTTFGSNGVNTLNPSPGTMNRFVIDVDSQDRIVGVGTDTSDSFVWRMSGGGVTDGGFGVAGTRDIIINAVDYFRSISVLPNDEIMIFGLSGAISAEDAAVVKLTEDGDFDADFGAAGMVTQSVLNAMESAYGDYALDGRAIVIGDHDNAGNQDMAAVRWVGTPIPDWSDGVNDWNDGVNAFGACLSSVGGTGSPAATWTASLGCPAADGAHWNALPLTAAKIAEETSSGSVDAIANLRFGIRTAAAQPADTYVAPVVFEAVAPNV